MYNRILMMLKNKEGKNSSLTGYAKILELNDKITLEVFLQESGNAENIYDLYLIFNENGQKKKKNIGKIVVKNKSEFVKDLSFMNISLKDIKALLVASNKGNILVGYNGEEFDYKKDVIEEKDNNIKEIESISEEIQVKKSIIKDNDFRIEPNFIQEEIHEDMKAEESILTNDNVQGDINNARSPENENTIIDITYNIDVHENLKNIEKTKDRGVINTNIENDYKDMMNKSLKYQKNVVDMSEEQNQYEDCEYKEEYYKMYDNISRIVAEGEKKVECERRHFKNRKMVSENNTVMPLNDNSKKERHLKRRTTNNMVNSAMGKMDEEYKKFFSNNDCTTCKQKSKNIEGDINKNNINFEKEESANKSYQADYANVPIERSIPKYGNYKNITSSKDCSSCKQKRNNLESDINNSRPYKDEKNINISHKEGYIRIDKDSPLYDKYLPKQDLDSDKRHRRHSRHRHHKHED